MILCGIQCSRSVLDLLSFISLSRFSLFHVFYLIVVASITLEKFTLMFDRFEVLNILVWSNYNCQYCIFLHLGFLNSLSCQLSYWLKLLKHNKAEDKNIVHGSFWSIRVAKGSIERIVTVKIF
jgi:hypothetical protein